MILNIVKNIEKYGKLAKGKAELIKHLEGGRLTVREMVIAKCYECMGWCADGKVDCEIPDCPNYPMMPYGQGGYTIKAKSKGRPLSVEQKEKMAIGRAQRIADKKAKFAV